MPTITALDTWTAISLALTLLSLLAAYYFFRKSLRRRRPVFYVERRGAVIVDGEGLTQIALKVIERVSGNEVLDDLVAIRACLINNGSAAIEASDVLKPLRIDAPARCHIIDFRVEGVSRDVCGFALKNTPDGLEVAFRIIEPGDGLLVTLFVEGSKKPSMSLEGAVKGVRGFEREPFLGAAPWWARAVVPLAMTVAAATPFAFFFFAFGEQSPLTSPGLKGIFGGVGMVLGLFAIGWVNRLEARVLDIYPQRYFPEPYEWKGGHGEPADPQDC